MDIKKAPAEAQPKTNTTHSTPTRPPYKIELTIQCLLRADENGLTELEALSIYGETCLHSSISTLNKKHNITVSKSSEGHIHRHGGKTYFTRYSLVDPIVIKKAKALLAYYQKKRGVFCADNNEEAA